MLTAEHRRLHKWLLQRYIAYRARRTFHSIRLSGSWDLLETSNSYPLVLYGNHHTWWDGFLDLMIARRFELDYYVMMDAAQLLQFPFFRKCGVFGIDLTTGSGRSAGLLHAIRLLKAGAETRRSLFIYPHGRLQPSESGPIPAFQSGLSTLLKKAAPVTPIPVYHWFRFGKHPLAEVFIHLGSPVPANRHGDDSQLVRALENARDLVQQKYGDPEKPVDENDKGIWLLPPPKCYRGKT